MGSPIQCLLEGLAAFIKRLFCYTRPSSKGDPYTIPDRRADSIYKETPFIQGPLPKGNPIQFHIEELALSTKRLLFLQHPLPQGSPIQFVIEGLALSI